MKILISLCHVEFAIILEEWDKHSIRRYCDVARVISTNYERDAFNKYDSVLRRAARVTYGYLIIKQQQLYLTVIE